MRHVNQIGRNYSLHLLEQKKYVAHRGLFNPAEGRPENSIAAFRYAVEENYPVELDVQMTKDQMLVVFHDESLKRMCGIDKKVRDCSYTEILTYTLGDSDEQVPLFTDVLKVLGGKVAVIVEIKSEGDWRTTTRKTASVLDRYTGPFVVESFHPGVVLWLKRHRPQFTRGQLSSDFMIETPKKNPAVNFLLTHLAFNIFTRPDFVAYNHKFRDRFPVPKLKSEPQVSLACWTVKSQEELEACRDAFDIYIFDSFIPHD